MCNKIWLWIIAILAIAMGILSLLAINNPSYMTTLMVVSRFFEVMLPILGVGALVKYVFCSYCSKCNDQKKCG